MYAPNFPIKTIFYTFIGKRWQLFLIDKVSVQHSFKSIM